jgi:hypothetical protein
MVEEKNPEGGTLADCSCLRNQVGALTYAFKAGFGFGDEIRKRGTSRLFVWENN